MGTRTRLSFGPSRSGSDIRHKRSSNRRRGSLGQDARSLRAEREFNPELRHVPGTVPLTAPPPYDFDGAVARAFPLRAKVERLQRFCDQYLNIVPPEIAHFRPALPLVFLEQINYGRMSVAAANTGYVSQNEVLFLLPVECYRLDRRLGRYIFTGFATVTPYIFVDDERSAMSGRMLGWPKDLAKLAASISAWAENPRYSQVLMDLKVRLPGGLGGATREGLRSIIEVIRKPREALFSEIPATAPTIEDLFDPLGPVLRRVGEYANSLGHLSDLISAVARGGTPFSEGPRGAPPIRGWHLEDKIRLFLRHLAQGRGMGLNTVGLKQFADAELPTEICYQALVTAQMSVRRYNNGGLLWRPGGDPSGGFHIAIHELSSLPIVNTLGIHVRETVRANDGQRVAIVEPSFPVLARRRPPLRGVGALLLAHARYQLDDRQRRDQARTAAAT